MRRSLLLTASAALALVTAGCALGPPQHGRVIPAEQRTLPWTGTMPRCDDPAVIAKIGGRFAEREREFWHSPLSLTSVDRIRQIALRPWGSSYIPRRYCQLRGYFSDHRYRTVTYSIGEDTGIIGATWGVEWCVAGLDRHYAFAPHCKAAGP